ncbi:MAG: hypothetical protein BMS9Abin06_0620 [Gammaproteobacteria bacterium]|nr:MAG: hypothetical protein BMS9Abin06_0620 [Gammaproteobacteria bacterium]
MARWSKVQPIGCCEHSECFGYHGRVFDAGKSLPRERSECFGYDFHSAAAVMAGFDVDKVN